MVPGQDRVFRENKEDILKRLSRIEGQVRGIARMIEEDRYCVDVLNQVAASRAALNKVGLLLLETHVRGCVVRGIQHGDHEATATELMAVISKLAK
ncbi:MAG: metal-sensitive transcriptional regulator [Bacillota bacterium]